MSDSVEASVAVSDSVEASVAVSDSVEASVAVGDSVDGDIAVSEWFALTPTLQRGSTSGRSSVPSPPPGGTPQGQSRFGSEGTGTRLRSLGSWACVTALAAVVTAGAGCSPQGETVVPAAPAEVMSALAGQAARPVIGAMAETARKLDASVAQLCSQPDAGTLEGARNAWREAYVAWRRAGPFLFGPGDDLALDRRLGTWPVNDVVVDAVTRDPSVAAAAVDPGVRGYAAVEYMLFAPSGAAAATADQRCSHLAEITGEIAVLTGRVEQQWRGDYGKGVAAAADMQAAGPSLSRALADTLNLTENLLWQRVGTPSSFFREAARTDKLEAWRSGVSREGLAASVDGIGLLMTGGSERPGVAALIAARDPVLAGDLAGRLRLAASDLAAIDRPLGEVLADDGDRLQAFYDQMQEVQNLIADATGVLALNVDFQEDGD